MPVITTPLPNDLPPRTWRHWWLEWPKWFRIGCRAALWMMILNLGLVARMICGLDEPKEIAALRERGAKLQYFWEGKPERFRHHHLIIAGLYGRSWANLIIIRLNGKATEKDLKYISDWCWRLKQLSLQGADVSNRSFGELRKCPSLEQLDLTDTDVDDDVVAQLASLPRLTHLDLSGTLASDRSFELLKPAAGLRRVNFGCTDVSLARIEVWRAEIPHLPPVVEYASPWIHMGLLMTIRWSDGTRSSGFRGEYVWRLYESANQTHPDIERTGSMLTRQTFAVKALNAEPRRAFDYSTTLKLGTYESEPATFNIGSVTPAIIEFRMPCTKAEALRPAEAGAMP